MKMQGYQLNVFGPEKVLHKISNKKNGSTFNKAGKVVSKPEAYRTDDLEQDIVKWIEFYDSLKIWLLDYMILIDYSEAHINAPIGISMMDGSLVFRLHMQNR